MAVSSIASEPSEVGPGTAAVIPRGYSPYIIESIVARNPSIIIGGPELLAVQDCCKAILSDPGLSIPILVSRFYDNPAKNLTLAGITGTNGKTTTCHLISHLLSAASLPHGRLGTTGNWLVDHEVPTSMTTHYPVELQRMLRTIVDRGGEHAVIEVSSHAIVERRIETLAFRAVALTNLSPEHLNFHGSMESYFQAKCGIARNFLARDGTAIAFDDDSGLAQRFLSCADPASTNRWRASLSNPRADLFLKTLEPDPGGSKFILYTPIGYVEFQSRIFGSYNLRNLVVAAGIGLALGLDLDTLYGGLCYSSLPPGRLQRITISDGVDGSLPAVFIDFCHTEDSVRRVLEFLEAYFGTKPIVVIGCGGDRDRGKRPAIGSIVAHVAERAFFTTDNPRSENPESIIADMLDGVPKKLRHRVRVVPDRELAIRDAIHSAAPAQPVLLAGKGHETTQTIGTIKHSFIEADVARLALRTYRRLP